MAFQWATITPGSTTALASHINEIQSASTTLVTSMQDTTHQQKCTAYSCSALAPVSGVTKGDIIYGTWLTGAQSLIDQIEAHQYCTVALKGEYSTHNPAKEGTHCSGAVSSYNSGQYTSHLSGYDSNVASTQNSTRFGGYNGSVKSSCYADNDAYYGGDETDDYGGAHNGSDEGTQRDWYNYTDNETFNSSRSSIYLKDNIEKVTLKALDLINKINIVSFNYKNNIGYDPSIKHIGFIAEDTDELLSTQYHDRMDYTNCLGILIKAVQEISDDLKNIKEKLNLQGS